MWLFDVLFFDLVVDRTHEPCVPTLCKCLLFFSSSVALRFCRFAREGGCVLGHVVVVEFVGFGGFGFFL